jgi:hypothetical protein
MNMKPLFACSFGSPLDNQAHRASNAHTDNSAQGAKER